MATRRSGEMPGEIRVGVSGWSYRHWRQVFYPEDLPPRAQLSYALERFTTLEINRSFYSLVKPSVYRRWYEAAPRGFRYGVKGSRFITHNKKLVDIDAPLANFFASGVLELGEKLGPILWQLGPRLTFDPKRVQEFLERLPNDTEALASVARRHTMPGRETVTKAGIVRPVRHVLEPRHQSWFVPEMTVLARELGVALAFSHSSAWPYTEEITADFVYLRLHGPRQLYSSAYSQAELRRWAERIEHWSQGRSPSDAVRIGDDLVPSKPRDVYVYFDNDGEGHAPLQAMELLDLLGVGSEDGTEELGGLIPT